MPFVCVCIGGSYLILELKVFKKFKYYMVYVRLADWFQFFSNLSQQTAQFMEMKGEFLFMKNLKKSET